MDDFWYFFFIAVCIAFLIGLLIYYQWRVKLDKEYRRQEAQKKREAEEKANRIKSFYATHPKTRSLSEKIDMEWNVLLRNSGTSLLDYNPLPKAPTYTEGLYKGSLGDNISQIANAQKKEQYEKDMARWKENNRSKWDSERRAAQAAKELYSACEDLIKILEKIPGSDEVIEDVKKKRDYASNYLKQSK